SSDLFPPIEDCDILKVYYYDNYDFDSNGNPDFTYQAWRPFGDLNLLTCTKGMLTGTKVKILIDQILCDPLLTSVSFYDHKSRVIQQLAQNHFGHFDTLNTKYSFAGDVLKSRYTHSGATAFHVVTDSMVYDHARRLMETYQKINDQPQIQVAEMNYNEIGLLVEKNLHRTGSSSFLQSVDYSYNIRGWLTGINLRSNGNDNNDAFNQELVYDSTITALNCPANYNGNITASIWRHSGSSTGKGYGYFYDNLNRIIQSKFGYFSGSSWTHNQLYSNPIIEYDKNGNLKRLQRHHPIGSGYSVLDDLYYFYVGNNIAGVNDYVNSYMGFQDNGHYYQVNDPEHTTEYFYDNNGNLTRDLNKGITSIIYNHLNLPYKIELENNRRIYYIYDANGTKLRKYFYEDNRLIETTDYSGMFIYIDDHLDNILTSEGRMKFDDHDSLFYAEYFIKDHLGNVRTVITTDPNFNFLAQQTDYYPFGQEIPLSGASDNQIKYNSKELQNDAKLGWYDYGARFYDPVIGRFIGIDPLAERFNHLTPYNYADNSPIAYIDLWGLQKVFFQKGLEQDDNFQKAYSVERRTSGGMEFQSKLISQHNNNVMYFTMNERYSTAGVLMTLKNMKEFEKRKSGQDNNNLKSLSSEEVKNNMEDGKNLILIGVNSESLKDKKEGAGELNHEEVSHGINALDNKEGPNQNEEDHEAYYGTYSWDSPDQNTILSEE
ncbi:MAG: RHS repeat-associated core domain-containing protein, partial [Lentimicrobium sp.]|nr:RHS repeat-associated core domain-containing protein [Lentimicrobium sp.]